MEFDVGATFAGYRIERTLGSGGMGTVYLAEHPRLPRRDALKVLSAQHGDDPGFRANFLREAEVAARLRHPNLVAVHDRGEDAGRLWIAMQYVPGGDLSGLIRPGHIAGDDLDRVVHILGEAAQGLGELHRAGLLHRDVKPANILISEAAGRTDRVLVTDFGIARRVEDWTTVNGGGFSGTLAYAAPEQLEGGRIDHRVDVYALGCTLFQMLTGSVPFPRETIGGLIYAHLHEDAPPPSRLNPAVPPTFDAVVARAMAKDPADRYGSCGELAVAVRAARAGIEETVRVPRVSRNPEADKGIRPPRRRPGRRTMIAATLVTALVAGAGAMAAARSDDHSVAGPVTATPIPPRTGTVEPAEWGAYAYIAQAFPDLLPPAPDSTGYQAVSGCWPEDEHGVELNFTVALPVEVVSCDGDVDPVRLVQLTCNTDRAPITPDASPIAAQGSERWSRKSGSGTLFWGYAAAAASFEGAQAWLELYFEGKDRDFCRMKVFGYTSSGAELRARWWPDAPL
ncbi:serine/threonine-protein kinase [Nocardia inohanensis]|uniref:serine/threonine-protein kinase n=1 Tax=Nocardia inohanensis TaxID=209246 RepID=UPI000830FFD9|nr:serine/threonine-protein kinase [Nocardia inohanensis]